jgi:AcrR family transcriptional regulator
LCVRVHAQAAKESPITLQAKPEPRPRDPEQRRADLINAANTVFAEHGYDAATTRAIAERAGCAEGLIHRYFNGKRGLLLAIIESKAVHVVEEFEAELPDQPTVADEISRILLRDLELFWERREFMRVSVSQLTIDQEIGRTVSSNLNTQRVGLMLQKLRRHQAAGRIRADTDVEAIAYTLSALGFSIGFVFQACFGEDRQLARRIMTGAAQAISDGITPSTGEEKPR